MWHLADASPAQPAATADQPLTGLARLMAIAAAEAAAHPELEPRAVVDYPVDPWAHTYGVVPDANDTRESLKEKMTIALHEWMATLGLGPLAKRR